MAVALALFLAANTLFDSGFQARGTAAQVAFQWALVTTCMNLRTWPITGRLNLAALDRWLCLGGSTRARKWFSRVDPARLAESKMTEIVALVLATAEGLVADLKANVESLGVSSALLDTAADLFAFVFLAGLDLVANSLALEAGCFLLLVFGQQFLPQLRWVVNHEAGHLSVVFAAGAALVHQALAGLA